MRGDGSTLSVFPTEYGQLGGLICGESINSLAHFTLIAKGENIHAHCWPAFAMKEEQFVHETIDFRMRYHAFEGKMYIISVTGVYNDEMKDTLCKVPAAREEIVNDGGHSSIIGPNGAFLAGPVAGETIIYADADLERIVEAKRHHDLLGHYNRFDIFRLTVNEDSLVPLRSIVK